MSAVRTAILTSLTLLCLLGSVRSELADKNCTFNATECYKQLVLDLLDTTDNAYNMIRTFYPSTSAHPTVVTVKYCFVNTSLNRCKTWFWSTRKAFLIFPPRVFLFMSLLFSEVPVLSRIGYVTLTLPNQWESVDEGLFETLTYYLKLYSQRPFHWQGAQLSDAYQANSYSIGTIDNELYEYYHWNIIALIYCTHFLFPFLTITLIFCAAYEYYKHKLSQRGRNEGQKDDNEDQDSRKRRQKFEQVNVACITCLCIIFLIYVVVLDFMLLFSAYTVDHTLSHNLFFASENPLFVFPLVAAISEMVTIVVVITYGIIGPMPQWVNGSKWLYKLFMVSGLCVVLCLSFHTPSIITAWATNDFHAVSILYWYVVVLGTDFITCKVVFELRTSRRTSKCHQLYVNKCDIAVVFWFLFLVSALQITLLAYTIIFPTLEELDNASRALNSTWQFLVLVIGGFISWKIIQGTRPPWQLKKTE